MRIAEIIATGIEYREVAVIAVGDAEIIKARLQRMHIGQATERELALEEDAAVEAQHRRGMAGRGLAAGDDVVEIIAGVVEANLRKEEITQALLRPGDGRLEVDARAGE